MYGLHTNGGCHTQQLCRFYPFFTGRGQRRSGWLYRGRARRVESNHEGKAPHAIIVDDEGSSFGGFIDDDDEEEEMRGYFYYAAATAETTTGGERGGRTGIIVIPPRLRLRGGEEEILPVVDHCPRAAGRRRAERRRRARRDDLLQVGQERPDVNDVRARRRRLLAGRREPNRAKRVTLTPPHLRPGYPMRQQHYPDPSQALLPPPILALGRERAAQADVSAA
jgi:hypothetical protein